MRFLFQRNAAGAAFVHPLQPAPRTAILVAGFHESRLIRTFPGGWTEEAQRFRPTALAAPLNVFHKLAGERIELRHASIVFSYHVHERLSDPDRDWLWRAFGVPVYEQILGPANNLLAAECDAHNGLHVMGELPGVDLELEPCGCGSSVPRLMQTQPVYALGARA